MNIATVEQLAGAIPQNEFVNFIAFIAKSDNDYKKPIEVIASAVKEFEKLRANQVKNSGMENEIKALVDKCRYVSNIAYDRKPKGLNFTQWALTANFLNFPNVFTKDEQFLLNDLANPTADLDTTFELIVEALNLGILMLIEPIESD